MPYCHHLTNTADFCPLCDQEETEDTKAAIADNQPLILFATRPNHLRNAAIHAHHGCEAYMEAILPLLSALSSRDLLDMHKDTLFAVAKNVSWRRYSAAALDLLSGMLQNLSITDLLTMHPETLSRISQAASIGSPSALNALSPELCHLRVCDLALMHPNTLFWIAQACISGSPSAFSSISPMLNDLSPALFFNMPDETLLAVAQASDHNHDPATLIQLSQVYNLLPSHIQQRMDPNHLLERRYPDFFQNSTPPLSSAGSSPTSTSSLLRM